MFNQSSNKCFCAFCKIERKLITQRDAGWTNVLLSILAASFFQMFLFQAVDGRILLLSIFFLFISHVFIRIRWRLSMSCPHCGFDPVLYKTNKKETALRVKLHLENLKKNGHYMMRAQNPFQTLKKVAGPSQKTTELEISRSAKQSLDAQD